MKPISYDQRNGKGLSLLFECLSCGEKRWNIAIINDHYAADNYDQILRLSSLYQTGI